MLYRTYLWWMFGFPKIIVIFLRTKFNLYIIDIYKSYFLNLFSLPIKFRKKWIALIDKICLKCLLKFLYIEQDITTLRLVSLTNHKIYNATIKICIQMKCVQCSDFITSGTFHWWAFCLMHKNYSQINQFVLHTTIIQSMVAFRHFF